jgi:hypothetical protein
MGDYLMRVAIIFIGTAKYIDFLPLYYEKCEENFLVNTEKTYFVFTDGEIPDPPENMRIYSQEHLPWPYITLKRFEIINKANEELYNFDWVVFMDADTLVVNKITEEKFFSDNQLFGVHHPCAFMKMPPHNEPPGAFETNPISTAWTNDFSIYYQGCFWGGRVPHVMDLIDELEDCVNQDLENNIVAVWHDESHLNRYFSQHKDMIKVFGPEYSYPESLKQYFDFEPKIVHLAKNNSIYHR